MIRLRGKLLPLFYLHKKEKLEKTKNGDENENFMDKKKRRQRKFPNF